MSNLFPSSAFHSKKRTATRLVEESRTDADFILFLLAAVFITTIGLLMSNVVVIVGAMLVAPILFPILALGLGVVTGSGKAIFRALKTIAVSILLAVIVSALTASVADTSAGLTEQLELLIDPALFSYFLISFAAGLVASFSWIQEDIQLSFPGVAITVSLVPPLAAIGISVALLSTPLLINAILLFVVNLIGVLLASVVIFAFFGFKKVQTHQDKKIVEEESDSKLSL